MTAHASHARASLRARLPLLAAALALLLAAVGVGVAATADAARLTVLGKTKRTPAPNCPAANMADPPPAKSCQVMGQVTGFQRSADGRKNLFKARQAGKIVAWSVDLSRPNKEERTIFGESGGTPRYGKGPTAGIGIIRAQGKRRFKLLRRSPIVKMGGFYNEKPVITLNQPLRMRKGDIVALTTPTWLPNFSVKNLGPGDRWVASRKPNECTAPDIDTFFEQSSPHLKKGSTRRYGCTYDRARLLYWAYFVPNRRDRN